MKRQINGMCLPLCLGLAAATVATITGCAGDRYSHSTGQYVDDKSLTMRVHDALSDNLDYKFNCRGRYNARELLKTAFFVIWV